MEGGAYLYMSLNRMHLTGNRVAMCNKITFQNGANLLSSHILKNEDFQAYDSIKNISN